MPTVSALAIYRRWIGQRLERLQCCPGVANWAFSDTAYLEPDSGNGML